MNKGELIAAISKKTGAKEKTVKQIVDAVFSTIRDEVAVGNEVKVREFGTFFAKERKARKAVNPQTGEQIIIQAHFAPVFRAGKSFKDQVRKWVEWADSKEWKD